MPVLYLTNRQAASFEDRHFPELMEVMNIPKPKLIIRLTRSLFGKAFYKTKNFATSMAADNGFCVELPEMTEEDADDTEMAIMLFIKERLLPVAERTTALVSAYACSN